MNSRTLTAAFLREPRAENSLILIAPADALILADALEIADSAARCDIESNCASTNCNVDAIFWYDLSSVDPDDGWAMIAVPQAMRYLESRGLIERHPDRAELVRMVDAAMAAT